MNRPRIPGKWMAATLAVGVTFGSGWSIPVFGPIAPIASAEQAAAIANWNSSERAALIKRLAMCDKAADDFYSDPGNARYLAVKAASDKARALLLDPNTSSSKLNAAYHTLDSALAAYIEDYIRDASILERQTFQTARMLNDSIGTAPGTYPQEAADTMMAIIAEAQAAAYDPNITVPQLREQYLKYIEGTAVLRDSMNLDHSQRLGQLNQQRQTIAELSANLPNTADYSKLLSAFHAQANGLEALLADNSGLLPIECAALCVQNAYTALTEGLQLAGELDQASKLLDSPKGIRSGQYPSSAFGELRKAINKSASVLTKASPPEQLNASRAALAEAVLKFRSTLRP